MPNERLSWEQASRFDAPVPRYTSYPTVPHWSPASPDLVRRIMERTAARQRDLAVYVHLPFCASMCAYCGCNVVVAKTYEAVPAYLAALHAELDTWHTRLGHRRLVQLQLGGGSPTFLTPDDLGKLITTIVSRFDIVDGAEISVELDPATTSSDHLRALRAAGVNRLSVGVQDFDERVLEPIGRGGRGEDAKRTIVEARELGFDNINVDLMYGLPGQTPDHMHHNVATLAAYGVRRAAVFGYAHVPQLRPHQKRVEKLGLPSQEERWHLAEAARDAFADAELIPIGFDHYARHDDALAIASQDGRLHRNFQGYTVLNNADVLGLGASAVSDFDDAYLQNQHRTSRYTSDALSGALGKERMCRLTPDDRLRRRVIFDLMCDLAIDTRAYGVDFAQVFAPALEVLEEHARAGLVELGEIIIVRERARPLLRTIANAFDAYSGGSMRAASRAV